MAQKHPTLWHLREQHGLTRELVSRFKERAEAAGLTPTAALVRLMRQYIDSPPQRQDSGTVPQPPHEF
jgi:hypothetical protein